MGPLEGLGGAAEGAGHQGPGSWVSGCPGPCGGLLAELRSRITDRHRRLDLIAEERVRTFRDARQLGLTNPEIRRILTQLADQQDALTRELRTLEQQARLAEAHTDPITHAYQLAQAAAYDLDQTSLEDQATLIDLLDLQATPVDGGYEITGTIPRANLPKAGRGKIPTEELRDRAPHRRGALGHQQPGMPRPGR